MNKGIVVGIMLGIVGIGVTIAIGLPGFSDSSDTNTVNQNPEINIYVDDSSENPTDLSENLTETIDDSQLSRLSSIERISTKPECSWNNEWCYKIIDISEKIHPKFPDELQIDLEIIQSGTKNTGQVDVSMSVTDPNSKKSIESVRIDTVHGKSVPSISFDVPLSATGPYSVFFELKSPTKIEDLVFDTYMLKFELES